MLDVKIFRVAYAIGQAEGWGNKAQAGFMPQGSRSYRNHNPGNLRLSPYQVGTEDGFAVFNSDFEGYFGIVYQLTLYANGASQVVKPTDSIATAISKYNGTTLGTPANENYMKTIEQMASVNRNDPVSTLLTP